MTEMRKNYKCLRCGLKTMSSNGMLNHVKKIHGEAGLAKGLNWDWGAPVEIGEKKKINALCTHCNEVFHKKSIYAHISVFHKRTRVVKGKDWLATTKEVTRGNKAPKQKPKATPRKKPQKVIAPNMQYIEVPAIIRIPISMGPIQIVSIGD